MGVRVLRRGRLRAVYILLAVLQQIEFECSIQLMLLSTSSQLSMLPPDQTKFIQFAISACVSSRFHYCNYRINQILTLDTVKTFCKIRMNFIDIPTLNTTKFQHLNSTRFKLWNQPETSFKILFQLSLTASLCSL